MKSYLSALFAGGLLLCSSLESQAQTIIEIRLSGAFTSIEMGGHPDYEIGDTFSFSLQVNDSSITHGGRTMFAQSIISSEFLINGVATPHGQISYVGLEIFDDPDYPPDRWYYGLFLGGQSVGLNPSKIPIDSVAEPVGLPFELTDFLIFDGVSFSDSDFILIGPLDPMRDGIRGPVTSISVQVIPEPSSVVLAPGAAGGAWLLSRRRRQQA